MVIRFVQTETATYAVAIAHRGAGLPPADQMAAFFESFEILKK